EQEEIFNLLKNNGVPPLTNATKRQVSDIFKSSLSQPSSQFVSPHKIIVHSLYEPMDNYIVRSLSKEDLKKFNILLLRLTVSCEWALSWVNKPEAKELFNFLNPLLKLSDYHLLGGKILKKAVENSDELMESALREDPVGITLTFDGWINVKNEQLLGMVLITSEGRPFVWKAVDISLEWENHIKVMEKIQSTVKELNNKQITICAIVTDKSVKFKTTIDKGIRLATYFRNSNNKFFIVNLKELQYETYQKYIMSIVPAETRWNSIYIMCTSLLNTQKALQILTIKFEPPIVKPRRKERDSSKISQAIFEIINSETFWRNLLSITKILEPYNKILNILQRDKARLFQVTHSFGYLAQFWSRYDNFEFAAKNHYVWRYWCYISVSTSELSFVACRIFGICTNAVSVERLWSCIGFLQTNRRNRLMSSRALEISKLRTDITYSLWLTFITSTISEPLFEIVKDNENNEINNQENNEENNEDQNCENLIDDDENLIDGSDEEFENEYNYDDEDNIVDNIIHPAIDTNAKWELTNLFKNNLKLPF
ncbi:4_t:CDS:2, partial [Diversispora eburnea]